MWEKDNSGVGKYEMMERLVCPVGGVIQERSEESTGENIV